MQLTDSHGTTRPGLALWGGAWCLLVATQLAAALIPGSRQIWASPTALFTIVVIAASLCAIASLAVLVAAWRADGAELGIGWHGIGLAFPGAVVAGVLRG